MKKLLTILLVCGFIFPTIGAVTELSGKVNHNRGGVIRLVMFSDLISYKKLVMDRCELGPDGSFELSAEIDETTYAMVEYHFQSGEIFLEPGEKYEITVTPEMDMGNKAYYDRPSLTFVINNSYAGELNASIQQVNMIYNDFLLNNAYLLQSPSRKAKVYDVIENMSSEVEPATNEYISQYLRYKVASLEMFFRIKSDKNLAAEYLAGKPILYGNVEYMDFFHIFFEKYLLANNPHIPYSKTATLVNGSFTYEEIIDSLMKDPVLKDPRLAEMVLMKGLDEMSDMAGFKAERIMSLLGQVAIRSPFQKHRQIAGLLQSKINWMKPGTPAPQFHLSDVNGEIHRLTDYKGKYLYISFISFNSPSSLAELEILAGLYPDYHHQIEFISIHVDELKPGWPQLIADYRINWALLLANDDLNVLEQYGATYPPVFVLLDPEGNILRYPAPNPSENLKTVLDSF